MTEAMESRARRLLDRYPRPAGALMPLIDLVLADRGGCDPGAARWIAGLTGLSAAAVAGIASSRGEPSADRVRVCAGMSCRLMGGEEVARRLRERLAAQALFAAAGRVLAVSAAAAPAWAHLGAWNAFGRELLRLQRLAEAHPKRWPVATLREVPATIHDLVSAAVPEPGTAVAPRAAQRCRRSLADFSRLLATQAERLAALLAVAPDRTAVERLVRCARRRDLQLIERADLRDRTHLPDRAGRRAAQGPLLAHAIILRRLPVS